MDYIIVDTENIDDYSIIENIKTKGKKLNVVLFKSNKSKPVKAKYWDVLFNDIESIESIDVVGSGAQNMDIQIAGYIGYISSLNDKKASKIYIVSNDKHFSNLEKFFNSIENKVQIININKDYKKIESAQAEICVDIEKNIDDNCFEKYIENKDVIINLKNIVIDLNELYCIFENSKTLQNFHCELQKKYKNDSTKIYKLLKKYFSNKGKSKKSTKVSKKVNKNK